MTLRRRFFALAFGPFTAALSTLPLRSLVVGEIDRAAETMPMDGL